MERRSVKITIKSTQHNIDNMEDICHYTGHYAFHKNEHIISYEEPVEKTEKKHFTNKNLFKITDHSFYISKTGDIRTKMLFKEHKKHHDLYQTPFGSFPMQLDTKQLDIHVSDKIIHIFLNYDLHLNHSFISNCTIKIEVEL